MANGCLSVVFCTLRLFYALKDVPTFLITQYERRSCVFFRMENSTILQARTNPYYQTATVQSQATMGVKVKLIILDAMKPQERLRSETERHRIIALGPI